jgi:excisionase family DNA binding protein
LAERYLTAKEIQARLGVSRSTSYEIAAKLTRVRIGVRAVRVPESAFNRWIRARTEEPENTAAWATDFASELRRAKARWSEGNGPPTRKIVPRTKPRGGR